MRLPAVWLNSIAGPSLTAFLYLGGEPDELQVVCRKPENTFRSTPG
jgi:hypothetical protein